MANLLRAYTIVSFTNGSASSLTYQFLLLWDICEKTIVFNRQLINAHTRLMFREGTVDGLKFPRDGVNKHRNA